MTPAGSEAAPLYYVVLCSFRQLLGSSSHEFTFFFSFSGLAEEGLGHVIVDTLSKTSAAEGVEKQQGADKQHPKRGYVPPKLIDSLASYFVCEVH